MITGVHVILYSRKAEELRAFFRDVLKLPWVDAGRGWLIFAAPPTELAVHPGEEESGRHELYMMCDDVHATVAKLTAKGVEAAPVADRGWGLLTQVRLPDGETIGLYQPKHPTAIQAVSRPRARPPRDRSAKPAKKAPSKRPKS